eukprot:snap_masked-scaffold_2-processed-gene-16.5-mRNA-1 protein AED:1.00 eAED:1.00 QI:0/0/0/0/1/1/12/0/1034
MEKPNSDTNYGIERRNLHEIEAESNKEILRKFRKLKEKNMSSGDKQTHASLPFKSVHTYSSIRERIEIKSVLKTLSLREILIICFLIFVPVGTLTLNALLKREEEIFSNDLQAIQGVTFSQLFFLDEGKTVDLQLEFFEPGLKVIFAETVLSENGFVQIDPVLTLWKRPNEVIRVVDDIGPNSLDAVLVLNIENENDLLSYVAQISAFSSSQSGSFRFTVISVSAASIPSDTPFQLSFGGPGGRNGRSATLEEGEFYQIFAYSNNSIQEDLLNTAIYVRSPDGATLATNFGTSESDFSARLLFQATQTGNHIFEIDAVGNEEDNFAEEATLLYSVISPTEIDLNSITEIEAAISQTYLFTFEEELEYEIFLESNFLEEYTQLINRTLTAENIEIRLPRFPPSLTLRIQDPSNAELLNQTETKFDYEFSLEEGVVVMNPVNLSGTSLKFSSNLGNPLLLEVFPTNPEYYTEEFYQVIGSFTISISFQPISSTSSTAELVDPNDPYSECFENPLAVLAAGCNSAVYLYCRNKHHPFENLFAATINEVNSICTCVGYMCQELPSSEVTADQTVVFSLLFDSILLIVGIICLSICLYLFYDYKKFFKENKVSWKVPHKVSWILSVLFYINLLIYSSTGISLGNFFQDLTDMNEAYIGRQETFFGETDSTFYENNPFDDVYSYLDGTLGLEYEDIEISGSSFFLNSAAQEIFDNIMIDSAVVGDIFAYSQAILESLAMIQFIEISIAWVYVSFSASAVLRKKAQNQKERVILYIRVFQFTVGLNMLWYTLARFISGGKTYSSAFFYLYALTAALVGGLLFYVILLFRRAVMLDRIYQSKLSTTKLPSASKRKKLEDIIKPIENAALTLICCVSGITVANIYFGVNYASRMARLRSRNENVSKSFETFNDFCLIAGMICIFVYLFWSNNEAKDLLFEDSHSQGFPTREGGGTSYILHSDAKQSSSPAASKQQQILSGVEMPQTSGLSFYFRFRNSTNLDISTIKQTNIETNESKFETSEPESFIPARVARTIVSEVEVPT